MCGCISGCLCYCNIFCECYLKYKVHFSRKNLALMFYIEQVFYSYFCVCFKYWGIYTMLCAIKASYYTIRNLSNNCVCTLYNLIVVIYIVLSNDCVYWFVTLTSSRIWVLSLKLPLDGSSCTLIGTWPGLILYFCICSHTGLNAIKIECCKILRIITNVCLEFHLT